MRLNASGNESKPSNKQHEHHYRVKEARGTEIDMEIGDYAGKNEEGASYGEEPTSNASASPEENTDAKKHWQERNAECVFTIEVPVGTQDGNLIDQQVSANAGHRETQDKMTEAPRGSTSITERSVFHGRKYSRLAGCD
ncbi:MAG: hypothetical protein ABSG51_11900 [Terracidiphilus sp.]